MREADRDYYGVLWPQFCDLGIIRIHAASADKGLACFILVMVLLALLATALFAALAITLKLWCSYVLFVMILALLPLLLQAGALGLSLKAYLWTTKHDQVLTHVGCLNLTNQGKTPSFKTMLFIAGYLLALGFLAAICLPHTYDQSVSNARSIVFSATWSPLTHVSWDVVRHTAASLQPQLMCNCTILICLLTWLTTLVLVVRALNIHVENTYFASVKLISQSRTFYRRGLDGLIQKLEAAIQRFIAEHAPQIPRNILPGMVYKSYTLFVLSCIVAFVVIYSTMGSSPSPARFVSQVLNINNWLFLVLMILTVVYIIFMHLADAAKLSILRKAPCLTSKDIVFVVLLFVLMIGLHVHMMHDPQNSPLYLAKSNWLAVYIQSQIPPALNALSTMFVDYVLLLLAFIVQKR